jgi:hypothetical protein
MKRIPHPLSSHSSVELLTALKEAMRREKREDLRAAKASRRALAEMARKEWHPDPEKLTKAQYDALKSRRHTKGFTRKALASIGVPWPPPPSWKIRLLAAYEERHRGSSVEKA